MSLMDRREFLQGAARVVIGSAVAMASPSSSVRAVNSPELVVVRRKGPAEGVRRAIQLLGGMERYVSRGDRVVIKPNIGFPNPPSWGSTTHPEVIAELARQCIQAGATQVLVLDHPIREPRVCLEKSGIRDSVKGIPKTHAFVLDAPKFFRKVDVPKGEQLTSVEILRDVIDSNVFINAPVAKSHMSTGVTLGMKNLMGVIWDRYSFHSIYDINQAIADLSSVLRANLTMVDATRVMIQGGPSGPGRLLRLDTIVAGEDPVAVDAYAVALAPWYGARFEGRQVRHIVAAHRMGLGEMDLTKVRVRKVLD